VAKTTNSSASLLQLVAAPAHQRVDHQGVLHVDQDADRRIDLRQRLDRQHGVEEARTGAAEGLRDLDRHHAEIEQAIDEGARDAGVLVHLAHQRPNLTIGECEHAVLEQPFVLGERGQGQARVVGDRAHGRDVSTSIAWFRDRRKQGRSAVSWV
jgi:hypothetical protein